MKEYKNKFTADGKVRLVPGVSKAKVGKVAELMEQHLAGDKIATATLFEVMTTSDAIFNFAHLATLNFLPNYDEAPRIWKQVAGTRTVDDFNKVKLWSLATQDTDGNGTSQVLGAHGEAPTIPEGTAYPYVYISGITEQSGGVTKKGFKTDWTLESRINDGMGVIDALPQMMLEASLDTEESEVFTPLASAGVALAGGTIPTGDTVVANAPLSRNALIRAMIELGNRQINGRNIVVNGGFNLLVAPGMKIYADYILNQTLVGFESNGTPNQQFVVPGYNPLTSISPLETPWLSGTAWKLVPKPGATRRPVIDRLELRGYQTPQLFVENVTGNFVGGGTVSPFEGSFSNDSITLKLRQFGGGLVYDNGVGIVTSTGAGT